MTIDSSKTLGGIGAILLLIGTLGFIADPLLAIVAFIGVILLLISLHGIGDYYKERGIFTNALFSFIALIIGAIVTFAGFVYLFFVTSFGRDFIAVLYPGFNGDWTTIPSLTFNATVNPTELVPFIGPILEVLAIMWVFAVVAGFFGWQSLKAVSRKASVSLFSTAGILLFVGAILAIVLIGLVLMWIAVLLMVIAFFQLKPQPEPPVTPQPTAV